MKLFITLLLGIGWVAALSGNTFAQTPNNNANSPNNSNENYYQGAGAAELLKPARETQPFAMSLEQQNQQLERKAFGRQNRGVNTEEPMLIKPLCVDPCTSPTVTPNNSNEGVGVVLPMAF